MPDSVVHSSHWGAFRAGRGTDGLDIQPHEGDRAPSPILQNMRHALDHPARVLRPSVRESWLRRGPGPRPRPIGEPFVEVSWDRVAELLANEVRRVREAHGPEGVYGGSYGWASAGRFHHSQSQIHRFLNTAFGGYVSGVSSYSAGAAAPLLPRLIGSFAEISRNTVSWKQVVAETELIVSFGGMPPRNSAIGNGGVSDHIEHDCMRRIAARGGAFHLFSPISDDMPEDIGTVWHAITPGTDTALILAMAYVLQDEGLEDTAFLETYCVGYGRFLDYLLGDADGGPKTPAWAERITGIKAQTIAQLARDLVRKRSLISVAHAVQRAEYGEQPVWAAMTLAAMVGQIGLPGRGFTYAFGSLAHTGRQKVAVPIPVLPQGTNRCQAFIPVAAISDMLLNPGAPFSFMGVQHAYPDIHLLWWAGGNPFHHHQDLHRLAQAIGRVDTFVVQEQVWTATAKSADIVLPISFSLERSDFGGTRNDPRLFAMQKLCPPKGDVRSDYDALSAVAAALGPAEHADFTQGRSAEDWLRHLYEPTRASLEAMGLDAPDFDAFWEKGWIDLPCRDDTGGFLQEFRDNPEGRPLGTPSGKIEIFSQEIAGYGYDDAPGLPVWRPHKRGPTPDEPFILIANAPSTRLHSQLDFGATSAAHKVQGREKVRVNPADAAALGLQDGDIARMENDRGACLAGVQITEHVRAGVVHLQTGAWFDPHDDPEGLAPVFCVHGNANVLTHDKGTSQLTHGCTGQIGRVALRKWTGPVPPIRAFDPPPFLSSSSTEPSHD
ncbi:molybdopterin-dependent oxidoreductase [Roseicyclus sp. F158]|uniref:Molybdopterin-dependent oxidoreductase n=1 Tax=Tropicimonas omnivorans TaxID=3075590 RepID=A0ABU3DE65_9RHOB|nr:molybdopterin-dependent oxidoreductase [Roseicyclus sp. F158]MDT0682008.1 molybdopterin-dependent oxidoreductase [Roseicyclus sp. F158]